MISQKEALLMEEGCDAKRLWAMGHTLWSQDTPRGTAAHGQPMLEQGSGKKKGTAERNQCTLTYSSCVSHCLSERVKVWDEKKEKLKQGRGKLSLRKGKELFF